MKKLILISGSPCPSSTNCAKEGRALLRFIRTNARIIVMVLLLLFGMLIISACTDPVTYRNSRISPYDFKGSEWQSEDPIINLQVQEDGQMRGYVVWNDEKSDIGCAIDWGYKILIHKDRGGNNVILDDYILEGYCTCTEQQVVITISKDYFFDGQYDTIILNRVLQ
ncbi:MAG: hypothetical protein K6G17_02965 [Oscillospiraceae bacterium]|nr:hypothetical protein [Oscillospiraceae bacterium]